ncbi:class I SAM-dependent methyltransferase [Actinoplanes sp. NPDC026670]|uniref:class I SAM-dependent methyltransferase n=1 Tax=Actinoplanes sp. NPDC026670 TaxID=3154700 RepID=UPI0033EDFEDD
MKTIDLVRETRRRLNEDGPEWTRGPELDFATVTLPERDCDLLRDLLIAERAGTVVEVGLAYGSSALAIGEALVAGEAPVTGEPLIAGETSVAGGSGDVFVTGGAPRHLIIDPFQAEAYQNVGWNLLTRAGLDRIAELIPQPSSEALPRLLAEGLVADAAFVDGSHRFHEVFVDLYYLRKIVKPGGLIILDDDWAPSIRTAVRYFERNLGWTVLPGAFDGGTKVAAGAVTGEQMVRGSGTVAGNPRCRAIRLPDERFEPAFDDFRQFVE